MIVLFFGDIDIKEKIDINYNFKIQINSNIPLHHELIKQRWTRIEPSFQSRTTSLKEKA